MNIFQVSIIVDKAVIATGFENYFTSTVTLLRIAIIKHFITALQEHEVIIFIFYLKGIPGDDTRQYAAAQTATFPQCDN